MNIITNDRYIDSFYVNEKDEKVAIFDSRKAAVSFCREMATLKAGPGQFTKPDFIVKKIKNKNLWRVQVVSYYHGPNIQFDLAQPRRVLN